MSAAKPAPLPEPPPGILFLRSKDDVLQRPEMHAYQHLLLRAWDEFELGGVMVIRGIPTVYLREDDAALPPAKVHALQQKFWNQGIATLLVLLDRKKTRVFSGMVPPEELTPEQRSGVAEIGGFVEELNLTAQTIRAHRGAAADDYKTFCRQVVSGHFYRRHAETEKFDPSAMVDAHLLKNLAAVRDELMRSKGRKLPAETAHAFLGRLLFTCYLVDRGIVSLEDEKYFAAKGWTRLRQVLKGSFDEVLARLYGRLFPRLKRDFNGSMFDASNEDLDKERAAIRPAHLSAVCDFFGAHDVAQKQQKLVFWPYDFSFIPVETISAIYENFLAKEGKKEKSEDGAFYTPRLLAEMTLDLALEGRPGLSGKRFLDPSCGSGIFLVLLFNRLAAEWTAKHPEKAASKTAAAFRAKDKALREALGSLRGVDKNPTACRIACFSLYLAFLDQFDPSDIREYIAKANAKLPNLLRFADAKRKPDIAVIWEGDFFPLANAWKKSGEQWDCIVGNPPWSGRSRHQTANAFMEETPSLLSPNGKATLILPTKVFFNKTDAFQSAWLSRVTLEKVVQLSDYRFLLFTGAICPSLLARFTPHAPAVETHCIEYLTPKVARVDLRQGAIPIAPTDRKEIPLRLILGACEQKAATMAWKSHFWGTPRDLKFLNHLFALPRLGELAGTNTQVAKGTKKWVVGQGCQPLTSKSKTDNPKPFTWSQQDAFVIPDLTSGQCILPQELALKLGDYFRKKGYRLDMLHRSRSEAIYRPPLVLFNQGFTDATFFDYAVRFQDSLQSIAGPEKDGDQLMFLAAYLRSRLARYAAFHLSANIGVERDKVHLDEALSFPFFLPGDAEAPASATEERLMEVVGKLRALQNRMKADARKLGERLHPATFRLDYSNEGNADEERAKWLARWKTETLKVQSDIEPLIYEYFGLNEQEIALVVDTAAIFDKSDTPQKLDTAMPTLEPIGAEGLKDYAETLAETLRNWSLKTSLSTRLTAGVDTDLALAVLRVEQTKGKGTFHTAPLATELAAAADDIEEAATTTNGTLVYLRDETWWFDGPTITLAKPALRGRWTRTAALNDAAEIYATIQHSRATA